MHAASDEGINPCEVYLVEIPEAARIFLRSFDQEAIVCLRLRQLRCRSSRHHRSQLYKLVLLRKGYGAGRGSPLSEKQTPHGLRPFGMTMENTTERHGLNAVYACVYRNNAGQRG